MKTIRYKLAALVAVLAALGAELLAAPPMRPRRVRLANTYDAAVETHEASVRRTNDAAVAARHLLWKQGAGPNTVALADASSPALGTIDNLEASTGVGQTILLLGRGPTKKMVASGEIAAGVDVFQAAGGKVAATGTLKVGRSLTATSADNQILEVNDHDATDTSGS